MKVVIVLMLGLGLTGCIGRTLQDIEDRPNDHKGAKIFYQGNGDGIAVGGGKGVHYEKSF